MQFPAHYCSRLQKAHTQTEYNQLPHVAHMTKLAADVQCYKTQCYIFKTEGSY